MSETSVAERQLDHAVKELLQERVQLLSVFCELAGADESTPSGVRQRLLQRFCQLLIDYVSLWQFEVQDLLLRLGDRHARAREMVERLQPLFLQAGEVALEFNDRYDATDHPLDLSRLDHHLSRLGEMLANRFDAEDRIISGI